MGRSCHGLSPKANERSCSANEPSSVSWGPRQRDRSYIGERAFPSRQPQGLVLAGDWTATGLPATIEGAVRSGRGAARVLLASGR